MENWLGNARTLDFSEVSYKLGATWAKRMFDAFQVRARRIPAKWPGTKAQARRLASAYFVSSADADRLSDEVQRIAVRTWIALIRLDAILDPNLDSVVSPGTAAIAP
jgi:hypothetical protein